MVYNYTGYLCQKYIKSYFKTDYFNPTDLIF